MQAALEFTNGPRRQAGPARELSLGELIPTAVQPEIPEPRSKARELSRGQARPGLHIRSTVGRHLTRNRMANYNHVIQVRAERRATRQAVSTARYSNRWTILSSTGTKRHR